MGGSAMPVLFTGWTAGRPGAGEDGGPKLQGGHHVDFLPHLLDRRGIGTSNEVTRWSVRGGRECHPDVARE